MKADTKKPYFFNVKKEQKCTLKQLKTIIYPPKKTNVAKYFSTN